MYSFQNDYSEGAHPKLLEALLNTNSTQEQGYGMDSYTQEAIKNIKKHIEIDCDVHLISGGTQTNLIAIKSFLRPHEAVIAAETGHIATHETGAIESTGHKIITVHTENGKLTPEHIKPVLQEHHFEHMVKPKLVYISNTTELGTVYTKEELEILYAYCQSHGLYLYADGARLGSALVSSDVTLRDMCELTDAFFIGGTKNGALIGEALVIRSNGMKDDYRYLIKQKGALLAKGRILGIQFNELFRDNSYFDLAEHAKDMAQLMQSELKKLGCEFLVDSPSNQIFPIMKNSEIDKLMENYMFYKWKTISEDKSAIRLITSWATTEEAVLGFIDKYKEIVK